MKATPSSLSIYFLFHLTTTLLHRSTAMVLDYSAPAPAPAAANNDTEFILMSCKGTLYPEICYGNLAPYAKNIQRNLGRLARVAVSVSLSGAKHTAAHFNNLSRQAAESGGAAASASDPRAVAALQDCFSVFSDSVDQMNDSLAQLRRLGGSAEALRFQMSNVMTWMSAAETNEDTCQDGFEEVADGPLKVDACDRVLKVKQVTSNALALVNSFAESITAP